MAKYDRDKISPKIKELDKVDAAIIEDSKVVE